MVYRAFTIVEILAVVMIIAIAGMVGAWSFYQRSDSAMLRNGSRQLLAAVQSARLPAGELHYPSQLHINLEDQSYYITVSKPDYSAFLSDKTSNGDKSQTRFSGDILNLDLDKKWHLQDGITFKQVRYCPKNDTREIVKDSGKVTLNFYIDGSADSAVIQISRNEMVESIIISPCTARAQLAAGAISKLPIDIIDLN